MHITYFNLRSGFYKTESNFAHDWFFCIKLFDIWELYNNLIFHSASVLRELRTLLATQFRVKNKIVLEPIQLCKKSSIDIGIKCLRKNELQNFNFVSAFASLEIVKIDFLVVRMACFRIIKKCPSVYQKYLSAKTRRVMRKKTIGRT